LRAHPLARFKEILKAFCC